MIHIVLKYPEGKVSFPLCLGLWGPREMLTLKYKFSSKTISFVKSVLFADYLLVSHIDQVTVIQLGALVCVKFGHTKYTESWWFSPKAGVTDSFLPAEGSLF